MERGLVGSTQTAAQYAPNLNFHWGGRASKSLWLDSSGVLRFGEYNASGVPLTDGTIAAATFSGALSGNATTATTLATARTLTIGNTGKTFNGSANVSWSLAEIGAQAAGSYAAASHTHAISDVTGLQSALDGKAASSHTHTIAQVTGLQSALDGKQAAGSYAAASHTHTIENVTGLQAALDGKQVAGSYAAASHTHTIANVTGLQAALDGKQAAGSYAASSHTHTIANVTGLQSALDGKQAAGSYLTTSGKAADSELLDGIDSPRFVFGESGRRKGTNLITNWNQTTHQDVAFLSSENNTTNAPTTDYTYGLQYSFHRSGAAYRTQIVTSLYSDSNIWIRNSRDSDVWTSWKRLWHTGDFTSTNVSNWNTAFGWGNHASAGYQAASTAITTSNIGSQSVNYAATAGSADNIDGIGFRNTGSNAGTNADTIDSNGITYYTSGVSNFSGNSTDGALYSQRYNTSWQHQIAGDYRSGQIALRGRNNGTWQAWRTVLDTTNAAFAASMNQYVRTTDNVTFNTTTAPTILVNNQSDNTKGYRIYNTSNASVSAMFTNSANALVIGAGAFDQVQLNKKVLVSGAALGVNVAASATAGRIDASNDIVAYSSSDERLKHNITPIENALDKVKSLTGVEFDWKPEYKHAHGYEGHDTGIIAQQVQEVIPSAVRTNDTGFLAVRYEKLIGLLVEGMKEQQAQIEELKAKLDGLTK